MLRSIFQRVLGDSIGGAIANFGEEFKKKVMPSSTPSVREVDAEALAARARKGGASYVGGARIVTTKTDAPPTGPAMSAADITAARGSGGGIRA
jgi:hypothetical protein